MKKLIALLLMLCMLVIPMAACDSETNSDDGEQSATETAPAETPEVSTSEVSTPESIEITHSIATVEVPYNPQTIAILDFASLDILEQLGVADRVAGVPKSSTVYYLQSYVDDDDIVNLGSAKEVDFEALNSIQPDVIFIGRRLVESYDKLAEIAPTVCFSVDYEVGYMQSLENNVTTYASLFGLEAEAADIISGFESRVDVLRAELEGKTAISGMVTSSSLNTMANTSQAGIIFNELGMENMTADVESTHGNASSFELILDKNPDYLFVLDRDAAINVEGAQTAKEIVENEIVMKADAYLNDNLIYLTPDVWYLATGGITATDIMLKDIEDGVLK